MKNFIVVGSVAFLLGFALVFDKFTPKEKVSLAAPLPNSSSNMDHNLEIYQRLIKSAKAQNLSQKPFPAIIQAMAFNFFGAKYEANLLDKSSQESLVISLDRFDCLIFVETVLALSRQIALQDYNYDNFGKNLVNERYRKGEINGYCSRLHYFTEWLADNQKRGNIINLTQGLGGVPLEKKLDFMSSHRDKYPQLASASNYDCIVSVEKEVNQLPKYYIPTKNIRNIYDKLQVGDIIAIATGIPGLDVTHTGLVYRNEKGSIGIIHASPGGYVTIAKDLETYASKIDQAIGIMVARPIDPSSQKKVN